MAQYFLSTSIGRWLIQIKSVGEELKIWKFEIQESKTKQKQGLRDRRWFFCAPEGLNKKPSYYCLMYVLFITYICESLYPLIFCSFLIVIAKTILLALFSNSFRQFFLEN